MKLLKNMFGINTSSQDLSLQAFLQSPVATVITDLQGMILNINHSFTKLTGYSELDVKDQKMSLLKSGEHNNAFYKSFLNKLMINSSYEIEIHNRCKSGQILLMSEKIVKANCNKSSYFIITLEDITEQKKISERYQHLAMHDMLTGLPNRTLLKDRFSHALSNAVRSSKKLAILMCDLNEFKQINDTYGHNIGDFALKATAKMLQKNLRISDTISRYGGDEFVVILEQINSVKEVDNVVDTLNTIFPLKIEVRGNNFDISMSVGYSLFPQDGTTFEQLLDLADRKMYIKKDSYYGA